jgi:hypothetical protein
VLLACWSSKGGSGTTVVATALGLLLARREEAGARVADLTGDVPAVLGLPVPAGPGLSDWLDAGPDVPDDALARLEIDAGRGLRVLPWCGATRRDRAALAGGSGARFDALAVALGRDPRAVVVDCGRVDGAALGVAASASLSLLVIRPCFLALRRALDAPLRPSAVVLVVEEGRTLGRRDVEDVLGVPVLAEVRLEARVARAVDAGLLAGRLPRSLERALEPVVALHPAAPASAA